MVHRLSAHALAELGRRGISLDLLDPVLSAPEQKVPEVSGVVCYQSKVTMDGKVYLLRAMVNETTNPPVVVTVYRTSKIEKYWSQT
jgi:hypothetical protein